MCQNLKIHMVLFISVYFSFYRNRAGVTYLALRKAEKALGGVQFHLLLFFSISLRYLLKYPSSFILFFYYPQGVFWKLT